MMFLGLFVGFIFWKKAGEKQGFNRIDVLEFYIWVVIGLFIGNRIFHVIFYNWDAFLLNPLGMIFSSSGFSSHGGIIGGTLAAYLFCKIKKLLFWKWADTAIVYIALVAVFVRIGNFLNTELVGRVTSISWGVDFGDGLLRHPVQLYEAAKNFVVFGILFYMKDLNLPRGFIYWSFIFLFSFLRFFTEFYKEYLIFQSGLTVGQWLSLIFTLISGILLYLIYKKKLVLN